MVNVDRVVEGGHALPLVALIKVEEHKLQIFNEANVLHIGLLDIMFRCHHGHESGLWELLSDSRISTTRRRHSFVDLW